MLAPGGENDAVNSTLVKWVAILYPHSDALINCGNLVFIWSAGVPPAPNY